MAEEKELKESVKESVKNVVKETVSDIVRRLTKASTKKAIVELRKRLKEKAIHRVEGKLEGVTERRLEKQLNKSIKQVEKEIVKDNPNRTDFIKGVERGFGKGFEKYLFSLKGLAPLNLIVTICGCLLVIGGGVYVWGNLPTPPPECIAPADGATDVSLNPGFSWTPVSGATEYEFILALDAALTQIVAGTPVYVTTPSFGPVTLEYDTDYWYAVRATAPTASSQSICFFHTITPPPGGCTAPADGATDVSPHVDFSWAPVSGATEYEFILALDAALTDIIVQVTVNATSFGPVTLEYDTDYWYAVRAITPTASSQSICFFHTITPP
jgi:hypothetical protein